jgi:hypothetical protein
MLRYRHTVRWTLAPLCLASAVLAACATPQRSARRDLRLDTETAAKVRHASAITEGGSSAASATASAAARTVASVLAENVPFLLTLLEDDNAVGELEEQLVECARLAERHVNAQFFGHRSPTRQECGEEVFVDGCDAPISRAMHLGKLKHTVALQCAQQVLEQLWPAPFSINQRYRYYPNAKFLETVSKEEQARLIAQGCTRELWRTIEPDIVLHAGRGSLLRSVLTLDFKFPCPDTNRPRWTLYRENSAYFGFNQGQIYSKALGGKAMIISPQRGVIP